MNSCGCQNKRLCSERWETLGCYRQVPQAIGSEERWMVNEIKHFHWHKRWFSIINDLVQTWVIKQELLNLNSKFCPRAQIQLVTMKNSSTCIICNPSSNGTYLLFGVSIFCSILNIINLMNANSTESKTYSVSCLQIDFARWTAGQLTHRWYNSRCTCECLLTILTFSGTLQSFLNHQVIVIG